MRHQFGAERVSGIAVALERGDERPVEDPDSASGLVESCGDEWTRLADHGDGGRT
jgi:hypothetical protein